MFGYIGKHWRGELSLPQSYWVNGVLVLLPFNIYFRIVDAVVTTDPPHDPLAYIYLFTLPALVALPIEVWAGIGIWRSAGARIEGGRKGWAWVARIVVLINLLALIGLMINVARYTYSSFQSESFERTGGYLIQRHDTYVVFHGGITEASGDELANDLGGPKVKRLVINGSIGGFIRPALRVANVVKDRKLFVVALAQCESACTIMLAAGEVRAVTPTTATGFHRGTLMGLNDTAPDDEKGARFFEQAGLTKAFIAKIRTHAGPDDLYDPTLRELIDQGFITDIFEEETSVYRPAKEWCQTQPRLCAHTGRQNWIAKHGHFP